MYRNISIRACTLTFVYIYQDPGIQWRCVDILRLFYTLRFVQFWHKGKRDRWIDYRVFKRQETWRIRCQTRKPSLPWFAVFTEQGQEVPRERSRVSGGNSSDVQGELSRNFKILHVGAQQPPLCNPRVNYGSNGRSGKKRTLRSSSWKGKSTKEILRSISLFFIDYGTAANVTQEILCRLFFSWLSFPGTWS